MIEEYRKNCSGCGACEKLCLQNAIKMKKDFRGFFYPEVDYIKCIQCGLCKRRCPVNNKEIEKEIIAFAAYNKNDNIRKNSSSGGIFTALAEFVLDKGGIVFGATFDKDFLVEHISITNKEDLKKLRSSKYLQSNLRNSFQEAKKLLEEDKLVYFSGTPCQIEGLKAYLGKEYDNLITQDLICHGVPSPKVWEEYLKYKKKKIKDVNFRSKETSNWGDYKLKLVYEDGIEYSEKDKNVFMKLFLNNAILRESCYDCRFKKKNRVSDFTLADFWGLRNIDAAFYDERGISLLIVNSNKGRKVLENISDKIVKKEINLEAALLYNLSMIESSKKSNDYEKISELIEKEDYNTMFEGE